MTDRKVSCSRCGRSLRAPGSVEALIGPVCQAKRDGDARALLAKLDSQPATLAAALDPAGASQ